MIQKSKHFSNKQNVQITKEAHVFKGYTSNCNCEILTSFNRELQLKDTEFVLKNKMNNYCLN